MQMIDLEGDPRKHREGARKRGCAEEKVIAGATGFSPAKDSLKDCVGHNSELSTKGQGSWRIYLSALSPH